MQTTMELLDAAVKNRPPQQWHKELHLNRNALHQARINGRLSPVLAGALADKMGQDALEWIAIAVMESERESGAKDYLEKRLKTWRKRRDSNPR